MFDGLFLGAPFRDTVESVMRGRGRARGRQRVAVEALGELRDPRVLPVLLARLGDSDEQVAQAARKALVVLTGQDFGMSQRRWESWAEGWRPVVAWGAPNAVR